MNFFRKNLARLFFISFSFFAPIVSFAQTSSTAGTIVNPLGANGPTSFTAFIQKFLEGALKVGIPVVALAIIYCGFLFVSARGNTEKLTKAKEALLYTLIGSAILLGSLAIATLIKNTVLAL